MEINGKQALPLRLHCPLSCGGYIEKDVLMYLMEGDELFIFGKCGECNQAGNMTVRLIELMGQCPALVIQ